MNTFWLKIAALAVAVLALIVLVNVFLPSMDKSETRPKTFYETIERDDERLRAEPDPETEQVPTTKPAPQVKKAVESAKPRFRELAEAENVEAERLFEMALAQRKMGRLPGMGYGQMVDYCRQIIKKYPDSVYAFKARRMLADIPQRYRKQYKIMDEEMGFAK